MTTYEKIVSSLDLSRRAAELGLPQDGALFYWIDLGVSGVAYVYPHDEVDAVVEEWKEEKHHNFKVYAAWTAEETLGRLPWNIDHHLAPHGFKLRIMKSEPEWTVLYINPFTDLAMNWLHIEHSDSLADAALSMECWLAEQKLLPPSHEFPSNP